MLAMLHLAGSRSWTPDFRRGDEWKKKGRVSARPSLTHFGENIQNLPLERHAVKDYLSTVSKKMHRLSG